MYGLCIHWLYGCWLCIAACVAAWCMAGAWLIRWLVYRSFIRSLISSCMAACCMLHGWLVGYAGWHRSRWLAGWLAGSFTRTAQPVPMGGIDAPPPSCRCWLRYYYVLCCVPRHRTIPGIPHCLLAGMMVATLL